MAKAARKQSELTQTVPLWAHGRFHWNELLARDVEAAKRFYADTIGWTFTAQEMPDGSEYWLAMEGDVPVAGIYPLTSPEYDGMPECWMSYLAVDDVDARVAKALKAGARLMKPIFDVQGVGRFAILQEPGGAGVGWITPFCDEVAKGEAR